MFTFGVGFSGLVDSFEIQDFPIKLIRDIFQRFYGFLHCLRIWDAVVAAAACVSVCIAC